MADERPPPPAPPPPPKRPLPAWEDIAAKLDENKAPPEQRERITKKYLDAWEASDESKAPAYQNLGVSPKVAKYAEIEGHNLEDITTDEGDENAGFVEGAVKSLRSGLEGSQAAAALDRMGIKIPQDRFAARSPHERIIKGVGHILGDPVMAVAPFLGPTAGFAVSGATGAAADQYRHGRPIMSAETFKKAGVGAAKGAATGFVMGRVGKEAAGGLGKLTGKLAVRPSVAGLGGAAAEGAALSGMELGGETLKTGKLPSKKHAIRSLEGSFGTIAALHGGTAALKRMGIVRPEPASEQEIVDDAVNEFGLGKAKDEGGGDTGTRMVTKPGETLGGIGTEASTTSRAKRSRDEAIAAASADSATKAAAAPPAPPGSGGGGGGGGPRAPLPGTAPVEGSGAAEPVEGHPSYRSRSGMAVPGPRPMDAPREGTIGMVSKGGVGMPTAVQRQPNFEQVQTSDPRAVRGRMAQTRQNVEAGAGQRHTIGREVIPRPAEGPTAVEPYDPNGPGPGQAVEGEYIPPSGPPQTPQGRAGAVFGGRAIETQPVYRGQKQIAGPGGDAPVSQPDARIAPQEAEAQARATPTPAGADVAPTGVDVSDPFAVPPEVTQEPGTEPTTGGDPLAGAAGGPGPKPKTQDTPPQQPDPRVEPSSELPPGTDPETARMQAELASLKAQAAEAAARQETENQKQRDQAAAEEARLAQLRQGQGMQGAELPPKVEPPPPAAAPAAAPPPLSAKGKARAAAKAKKEQAALDRATKGKGATVVPPSGEGVSEGDRLAAMERLRLEREKEEAAGTTPDLVKVAAPKSETEGQPQDDWATARAKFAKGELTTEEFKAASLREQARVGAEARGTETSEESQPDQRLAPQEAENKAQEPPDAEGNEVNVPSSTSPTATRQEMPEDTLTTLRARMPDMGPNDLKDTVKQLRAMGTPGAHGLAAFGEDILRSKHGIAPGLKGEPAKGPPPAPKPAKTKTAKTPDVPSDPQTLAAIARLRGEGNEAEAAKMEAAAAKIAALERMIAAEDKPKGRPPKGGPGGATDQGDFPGGGGGAGLAGGERGGVARPYIEAWEKLSPASRKAIAMIGARQSRIPPHELVNTKGEALSTPKEQEALARDGLYDPKRKDLTRAFYDRYHELRLDTHKLPKGATTEPLRPAAELPEALENASGHQINAWRHTEALSREAKGAGGYDWGQVKTRMRDIHKALKDMDYPEGKALRKALAEKMPEQHGIGDAIGQLRDLLADPKADVTMLRRHYTRLHNMVAEAEARELARDPANPERGSFSLRKRRVVKTKLPKAAEALVPTEPKLGTLGRAWKRVKSIKEHATHAREWLLEYEPLVKEFPLLKNALRLLQGDRHRIFSTVADDVWQIVKGLDRKGVTGEMEQFRKAVVFGSMAGRARKGQPQAGGHDAETYESWHNQVLRQMTPNTREAYRKHIDLMRTELEELVRRGHLPASMLADKSFYYPHHVMDYAAAHQMTPRMKRLLSKMHPIFMPAVQQAKGSLKLIDTNYVDVMLSHLTKNRIAHALDDFARTWLEKADAWKHMTPAEKKVIRPQLIAHGTVVDVRGKPHMFFKYEPRRTLAEAMQVTDPKLAQVMNQLLHHKDRYYLVPEKVGKRFQDFYTPNEVARLAGDFRNYFTWWKRMWVDLLGLPFHVTNVVGDSVNLYREDAYAAASMLYRQRTLMPYILKQPTHPAGKAVMDFAYTTGLLRRPNAKLVRILDEQQVLEGSGWYGGDVPEGVKAIKRLQETGRPREMQALAQAGRGVLGAIERFGQIREAYPKIAKAHADFERIQNGGQVKSTSIDIRGLPPEMQLGKVAREATVDYMATPDPFRNYVRGMIAPFSTWYMAQAKDWPRYVKEHPGDALVKFGLPLAGLWYWNNVVQGDVEERNPDYVKSTFLHVNTGIIDKHGDDVIVSFQTGMDTAGQLFQLDKFALLAGKMRRGEITPEEAGKAMITPKFLNVMLREVGGNLGQLALRMVPVAGWALAMWGTGTDPMTKRSIVPSQLEGTQRGLIKQSQWLMQQTLPMYGIYEQTLRRMMREGPTINAKDPQSQFVGDWLLHGPFDLKRAFGFKSFNPAEERVARAREKLESVEVRRRESLAAVEEAATAGAAGDFKTRDKRMAEVRSLGVDLTAEDIKRRLSYKQNPRVYRDIMERLYWQERDPEKKEQYRQNWMTLQQEVRLRGVKQMPKATKRTLAKENLVAKGRKEAIDRMLQGWGLPGQDPATAGR